MPPRDEAVVEGGCGVEDAAGVGRDEGVEHDAERVVLKAIRKNHKSALQKAPAGYLGADARAIPRSPPRRG